VLKIRNVAILVFLHQLKLTNFRNYEKINIKLDDNINIFYGNNAQGKTNILESIYLLGLTKSHRSSSDNELIMDNKSSYSVEGVVNKNKIKTKLQVKYSQRSKEYYIDNNKLNKTSDYLSNMNVIIFFPDDIEIIKGLPEVRRKYLNTELSQLYPTYFKILNEYNKLLKMRNDFLKKACNREKIDLNYLNIITEYYIDKAIFLYRARKKFIEKLTEISSPIYENISKNNNFSLKYITKPFIESFDSCDLKKILKENIEKNIDQEIKLGMSLFGPHRDDFEFLLNNSNLKKYGSQGQQKLSVLVLKLSEIQIFENKIGEKPILLLDDVFSEFDKHKKNNILKYIDKNIQTIITTTDLNNIKKNIVNESKVFYIDKGNIIEK
jgi:DNA replication and repair protein RecF